MSEWCWVSEETATAIHQEQLAEHGGGVGIRDRGLLQSALARPQNASVYGQADGAELAAAYAYGIARNPPFIDGNKRTAWVVARLFLAKNDLVLRFERTDATMKVLALAAGDLSEAALADWLRKRIVPGED